MNKEVVILANGEFPVHPIPLSILNAAPFIICCDGASNQLLQRGITPHLIIGDGDSISPENRQRHLTIFKQIKEQESNDLTKAVRHAYKSGAKKVHILGATGKREDHTLGNISLLMTYARKLEVKCYTNYGIFIPSEGNQTFKSFKGQQISLFNFGATHMHAKNLLYPLSDFNELWQGTLNEATDTLFTIYANGKYLVFKNYKEESVSRLK